MKKSLILGILGLAAGVATSYGQGQITLDTYLSSSAPIVSIAGNPVTAGLGLYVGLYYGAAGVNAVGSVLADPTGTADPLSLYAGFILASGPGAVVNAWAGGSGQFFNQLNGGSGQSFQIQPTGTTQPSFTLMVVAYNNVAGYNSSSIRGHSTAFFMASGNPITAGSGDVGLGGMGSFSVASVPEPTTMALAGLGGLGLLLFRRKQV